MSEIYAAYANYGTPVVEEWNAAVRQPMVSATQPAANGSWFLPGEINPVNVGKVTSRVPVDPNSWLKDKNQQPHPCTDGTMEKSYMKFTNHVAIMAVLSANLIAANPAYAAGDEATHESRR